ncbi:MAG: 30S ribosomal protein S8 [Neomegalonema sp.]|nr:30S ribosomal protein S8 [Neomegalonema sp.]
MLARIRNGLLRGLSTVRCQGSHKKARVLEVLVAEGYLRGYRVVDVSDSITDIEIDLKYYEGQPAIKELQRVSKPGRRAYYSAQELPSVRNGLGVAIISTNRGVVSDARARELNVGGEVICTVF